MLFNVSSWLHLLLPSNRAQFSHFWLWQLGLSLPFLFIFKQFVFNKQHKLPAQACSRRSVASCVYCQFGPVSESLKPSSVQRCFWSIFLFCFQLGLAMTNIYWRYVGIGGCRGWGFNILLILNITEATSSCCMHGWTAEWRCDWYNTLNLTKHLVAS